MTMDEIVNQVSFELGIPSNENVEDLDIRQAVLIAFRELKRYIKDPVAKTVPYSPRLDLVKLKIDTTNVLGVIPSKPRCGLVSTTVDGDNVYAMAAQMNVYKSLGSMQYSNLDPIVSQMAMAQVSNTLSTDFQWHYDLENQVVYCTHRDPLPQSVTIRYVPDFKDVSEIKNPVWTDYLVRLSEAHMKKSLGRTRSKYTIEGSNVSLDGTILLDEANAELEAIRAELAAKKTNLVILN